MGAFTGYELARDNFLGVLHVSDGIALINRVFGSDLLEQWDSSISASMVLMIFVLFVFSWVLSPKYGLISTVLRRANQRRHFDDQVVLAHIHNHQFTDTQTDELEVVTLHEHFHWSPQKMGRVLTRLRALNWIHIIDGIVQLTDRGDEQVHTFRDTTLSANNIID